MPNPVRTDHLSEGLQAMPSRGAKLWYLVLIRRAPIRPSRTAWSGGDPGTVAPCAAQ